MPFRWFPRRVIGWRIGTTCAGGCGTRAGSAWILVTVSDRVQSSLGSYAESPAYEMPVRKASGLPGCGDIVLLLAAVPVGTPQQQRNTRLIFAA